jgi:hypothetical protein
MMDDSRFAALILAAVAFAIYLLVIGVALRLTRQRYAVRLLIGSALLIFALTVAWAYGNLAMIAYWHFAAFFGCGVAIVMFMYGAVLKSLSLRLLMALCNCPDVGATTAQLTNDVVRVAFEERIRSLENVQLVRRLNGGCVLTAAGERIASRIRRLQKAFGIGRAGFYWD